jgi:hypothetical protein
MSCCPSECYRLKISDSCISEENVLIFGTIEAISTQVTVQQLNQANGRIDQFLLTSDVTGELMLAPETPQYFSQRTPFRFVFYIYRDGYPEQVPVTINGVEYDCVEVTFGVI